MPASKPLPNAAQRLGALVTIYADRPLSWRDFWTRFLPGVLFAMLPLAYGLWRSWFGRSYFGPAAAAAWGRPWFLVSAAAVALLAWWAYRRVRRAGRRIKIYQNGVRIQARGRRDRAFLWRDLSGISVRQMRERFLWIPMGEHCRVTLYPHIGSPLRLDPRIPRLAELAARIKGKIYPGLLKALRSQRQAGRNLYFGPVSLTPAGLTLRGAAYAWEQVIRIDVKAGYLRVELKNHRTQKVSVGEIPNIELLIQLIQEGITP